MNEIEYGPELRRYLLGRGIVISAATLWVSLILATVFTAVSGSVIPEPVFWPVLAAIVLYHQAGLLVQRRAVRSMGALVTRDSE